jgi:hypothetical protein
VKGFNVFRKTLAFVFLLAACLMAATPVRAASPQFDAAARALGYIQSVQNPDGGFPDFGTDSTVSATLDAVLAFASAGINVQIIVKTGDSPIDFLEAQAADYAASTPGHAAKLVDVLAILGQDPHQFGGKNSVDIMQSHYDAATHRYGEQKLDQALYLLAEESLGAKVSEADLTVLKGDELPDGCWEFVEGYGCDTNSSAIAVQALIGAGVSASDASIQKAVAYFAASQNPDGGFPYAVPGDSDANSTSVVIQALTAAGEDVDAAVWRKSGGTPMEALLALQDSATGAFTYSGADNAYATYQAVPALLLEPLLLPPLPQEGVVLPTPASVATPSAAAPTAMPVTLASTGEGSGGSGTGWEVAIVILTTAGVLLVATETVRRRHSSKE